MPSSQNGDAAVILLDPTKVAESSLNPRITRTSIDDLVASVKEKGVLQPVTVRRRKKPRKGFELVFGSRRRLAAIAAEIKLPAIAREMTDREVLEAQLAENIHREDVRPLEEAEGFRRLSVDFGVSAEELAAKVAKSIGYVYGRLKLLDLCEPAKNALAEGKLPATHALLVARIPNDELQRQATRQILSATSYGGSPLSFRHTKEMIVKDYLLEMKTAPFDTASVDLVPEAGSCVACPLRSGNAPALFDDLSSDSCTNPPCWKNKAKASWKLEKAAAVARGIKTLEGAAARNVLPFIDSARTTAGQPLKALGDGVSVRKGKAGKFTQRKWSTIVPARKRPSPAVIARHASGAAVELFTAKELLARAKALGWTFDSEKTAAGDRKATASADAKKTAATREINRHAIHAALIEIVRLVERRKPTTEFLRFILRLQLFEFYSEEHEGIEERREWKIGEDDDVQEFMLEKIEAMPAGELMGLLVELALSGYDVFSLAHGLTTEPFSPRTKDAAAFLGVDLKKVRRAAATAHRNAEKAKAAKKKPAKKAKAKVAKKPAKKKPAKRARKNAKVATAPKARGIKPKPAKKKKPAKKRLNPWADMTPEEKKERVRKMLAGRKAKAKPKAKAKK